jgi:hypothetical protein
LKYAPDAYVFVEVDGRTKPFILEVQSTPITSKRWAEKWAVASQFVDSGAYKRAGFQLIKEKVLPLPKIMAISTQQTDTVRTGAGHLPVNHVHNASEIVTILMRQN